MLHRRPSVIEKHKFKSAENAAPILCQELIDFAFPHI